MFCVCSCLFTKSLGRVNCSFWFIAILSFLEPIPFSCSVPPLPIVYFPAFLFFGFLCILVCVLHLRLTFESSAQGPFSFMPVLGFLLALWFFHVARFFFCLFVLLS